MGWGSGRTSHAHKLLNSDSLVRNIGKIDNFTNIAYVGYVKFLRQLISRLGL